VPVVVDVVSVAVVVEDAVPVSVAVDELVSVVPMSVVVEESVPSLATQKPDASSH
jgi:hypothetical protein